MPYARHIYIIYIYIYIYSYNMPGVRHICVISNSISLTSPSFQIVQILRLLHSRRGSQAPFSSQERKHDRPREL